MIIEPVPAGRKTDLLVAEKVMHWRVTGIGMGPGLHSLLEMTEQMADAAGVPHYSTVITEAWPVFERLRDLMGPEVMVVIGYDHESEKWLCGEHGRVTPEQDGAETAPLAICRAALQAYGKLVLDDERQIRDLQRRMRPPLKLEE